MSQPSKPITTIGLNQYRCASCGGVFDKGWTDEEAIAELGDNFPKASVEHCSIVCDPCFNGMPVNDWSKDWKHAD